MPAGSVIKYCLFKKPIFLIKQNKTKTSAIAWESPKLQCPLLHEAIPDPRVQYFSSDLLGLLDFAFLLAPAEFSYFSFSIY